MSISPPTERRSQPRRSADRAVDDLQKTFSTPNCRSCLERMADGVLLLDQERRVVYATPQAERISQRQDFSFALEPKFILQLPLHAARFAAFANGKSHETGPLSLLLEDEHSRTLLLMTCFRLPKPSEPEAQAASYMITLRDPNHFPAEQWRLFSEQFNLTPAEARLCRTMADGLTLGDYCDKWKVTTGTARSQLHGVFGKTSTRRQSDLLRLIFLFTRT
jgi:DNA-binding CsgD family transcriptional regulator